MAYAEPGDVQACLSPDPVTGSPGEMTNEELTTQIDSATAQVEAALSARYAMPFSPVPPLVKAITVAIAAYLATLTYRRTVDLNGQEPTVLRYQWAIGLLTALQSGASDLPGAPGEDPGPVPAGARGSVVINRYCGRLFTEEDFDLTTRRGPEVRNPYAAW